MLSGPEGVLEPVFDRFPLWLVGLLLLAASLLAREAGSRLYRRIKLRKLESVEGEKSEAESHIIAAIFGLLAFVLGLTFSIALDRFDTRRALVAEEANAISTTYLRADMFEEPNRSKLQSTLREYAHTRIAPHGLWDEGLEAQVQRSLLLRKRLWDETRAAVYPVRETELASYFLDAISDTLDVGTRRQLAGRAHIPTRILGILSLYLVAAAAVLGYLLGDRPGFKRPASTALFVLFTAIILMVLDIDRPQAGAIPVSQRALEELVVTLDQDAPRSR